LLNVAIVLKQVFNLNVDTLIEKRTQLIKDIKNHTAEVTNKELKETLPTLKQLTAFRDNLFKEGKYTDYVINYLLMTGVRNADINAIITRSDKHVKDDKNYLILGKNSNIVYLRNNYKTVDKYKAKTETIKDKKLSEALNIILGEHGELPLLNTGGREIADSSLSKFVSTRTYKQIGQGAIFKVMVNATKNKEKLSAVRGTNLDTVNKFYDINFKNEEAKLEVKPKVVEKKEEEPEIIYIKKKKFKKVKAMGKVGRPAKNALEQLAIDYADLD
jgi:hypothetical protein